MNSDHRSSKSGRRKPTPFESQLPDDGLVARPSQPYALEKLYYVSRYMYAFATGMKNRFRHRIYIDMLAGPGRVVVDDHYYPGSPLWSFEAPFTERIFLESEPRLAAALMARVGATGRVLEADCNVPATIETLRAAIEGEDALSLVFIDNLGVNVPFETIRALTTARQADLLIVFQLQDFTRNVNAAFQGGQDRTRFDDFLGTAEWTDIVADLRRANAAPEAITSALFDFYQEQLGTLGYTESTTSQVMRNARQTAQYRLILASRHHKAVELFTRTAELDPYGQAPLPL